MNTQADSIDISKAISADLALRSLADDFFSKIERSKTDVIIVDFKGVNSITRSFAHEYITRKKTIDKRIIEENVPMHVEKMFNVVRSPGNKKDMSLAPASYDIL